MPIYMDRHYIEGATAHGVAIAHTADIAAQDRYRVRFLTYWFDEVRSTAFCLVDSPDRESIRQAHQEWHGLVPHEIIEVDPTVVEAFLGRVADPTPADPLHLEQAIDAAFRAIMFTDLKDSTLMTSTLGDARALHLLHVSNVLTRSAIRRHQGREIKHTGDGIMASFPSVPDAVTCGVAVQEAVAEHNRQTPNDEVILRIGLHAGEPIEEHGDLFGNAVQLAARLCACAGPYEILVSETIRDMSRGLGLSFEDLGTVDLKGFEKGVRAFSVRWASA
ncbi:MAG TPA: nickel-binding protein [Jiangellaceae bacterium]